jgi:NTE family protein
MKPTQFTDHPDVLDILTHLRSHFAGREMHFSDMVDGEGHQYVDLVQEGGGVWGVALLGYTYVLEEMGIRFASMGGTSAGAINTLLLAAANSPEGKRTVKILPYLANKNLFDFVDGNVFSRMTVRGIVRGESRLLLALRAFLNFPRLRSKLGLNPGRNFENWLSETIAELGVRSLRDLETRMNAFPEDIRHRQTGKLAPELCIADVAFIAAEIETGTKVQFPYHAKLFFKDYLDINPARFVRASMSIPLFFEPVILRKDAMPVSTREQWDQLLGHYGPPPRRAVLVDGGILSNFPIDVFHQRDKIPLRPTLGVKLMTGSAHRTASVKPAKPLRLGSFLNGNFSAARHLRDQEFIFSNPDYRHLVMEINVGNHSWIDFGIPDEGKIDLFLRGAKAAMDFMLKFDWERYKIMRATLIADAIQGSAEGLANATGKSADLLRAALEGRNQAIETNRQEVLLDRIKGYEHALPTYRILWVDDRPEGNVKEKELINSVGVGLELHNATSSAEAEKLVADGTFQLMISDIRRGDNPAEGIHMLNRLIEKRISIPIIFYIEDFDPSLGIPQGAFGITNNPAELLHLVMDAMARVGIQQPNINQRL